MKNYTIKRWDNGETIHSGEYNSLADCLIDAVNQGKVMSYNAFAQANLSGADLSETELSGTDLSGADFYHAYLLPMNNSTDQNSAE